MDRITESLLAEFSEENGITSLFESKRFEHFCAFVTVRKHHSEHFDTEDVVCGDATNQGGGGDTGIDGIAIIVNGALITDVEGLEDYADHGNSLDAQFVFIQAETTSGFDAAKIGNFAFGVTDFFKETPVLKRNQGIVDAAEIMAGIYARSTRFNRGNPTCRLYYVTTGKWQDDATKFRLPEIATQHIGHAPDEVG